MRHVDDFIDDPKSDRYAASWFESFRRPAIDKLRAPDKRKLFATYDRQRYLVTGCSRMGDVWLHADHGYTGMSYQKRVDVDACSAWSTAACSHDDFRACDQCGCCTNAKLRRCCDAGYLADKRAAEDGGPASEEKSR